MKTYNLYPLLLTCLLLAGCAKMSRSISHSDYRKDHPYCGYPPAAPGSDPAFNYRGELSEFDVLGLTREDITSEAEIRRALDNSNRVKIRPDSSILLIQSGAMFPDGPIVTELSKHFRVVPFSGVPPLRPGWRAPQIESLDAESYSKSLRLAAARGGNDIIVCYWGILESESENLPTKTVSWVPVLNWIVPDETQHMRIRLKVAIIDVRTGNWALFSPQPFDDDRISTSPRRGAVDQRQVERLKREAYEASAQSLVTMYSDAPDAF